MSLQLRILVIGTFNLHMSHDDFVHCHFGKCYLFHVKYHVKQATIELILYTIFCHKFYLLNICRCYFMNVSYEIRNHLFLELASFGRLNTNTIYEVTRSCMQMHFMRLIRENAMKCSPTLVNWNDERFEDKMLLKA